MNGLAIERVPCVWADGGTLPEVPGYRIYCYGSALGRGLRYALYYGPCVGEQIRGGVLVAMDRGTGALTTYARAGMKSAAEVQAYKLALAEQVRITNRYTPPGEWVQILDDEPPRPRGVVNIPAPTQEEQEAAAFRMRQLARARMSVEWEQLHAQAQRLAAGLLVRNVEAPPTLPPEPPPYITHETNDDDEED